MLGRVAAQQPSLPLAAIWIFSNRRTSRPTPRVTADYGPPLIRRRTFFERLRRT
jgi:hypothetical protein